MPEEVKKDLEKWESKVKTFIGKLKKMEKEAVKDVRAEAKKLAKEGKEIGDKIDKKMDKAEENIKKSLKQLRDKTAKAYNDFSDAWYEVANEPVGEKF